MAIIPQPPPLSKKEFKRRWEAGARTIKELDPALWAWHKRSVRMVRFLIATLLIGASIFVGTLIYVGVAG